MQAQEHCSITQKLAALLQQFVLGATIEHDTLHSPRELELHHPLKQCPEARDFTQANDIERIHDQQFVQTMHRPSSDLNVALRADKSHHQLQRIEIFDGPVCVCVCVCARARACM